MSKGDSGYRAVLPQPTTEYSLVDQQVNRYQILRALDRKLDRNEPAIFGGIPYFVIKGTNNNFSVPNGTGWTKIVGTALYRKTDDAMEIDGAASTFKPLVVSDVEFKANLNYIGGGNGTSAQIYVGMFADGVLIRQGASTCLLEPIVFVPANFIVFDMDPTKTYDIRIRHDESTPVRFDLTTSYWGTTRMSSLQRLAT